LVLLITRLNRSHESDVPDPLLWVDAAWVYAPKLLRFVFHLWAFVSPMEKYSDFKSDQNKFSVSVETRICAQLS